MPGFFPVSKMWGKSAKIWGNVLDIGGRYRREENE
jgi:hypothetical protein